MAAVAFIFPNADGGFMDTDNYRFRVLKPLAEELGIPKLNFQIVNLKAAWSEPILPDTGESQLSGTGM